MSLEMNSFSMEHILWLLQKKSSGQPGYLRQNIAASHSFDLNSPTPPTPRPHLGILKQMKEGIISA